MVKKHLPNFLHPGASEHIQGMLSLAHNNNNDQIISAEIASDMYRNPYVIEMLENESYAVLSTLSSDCYDQIVKVFFDIGLGRTYAQYGTY